MLVILEGPRNSGKTTVAQTLKKRYGDKVTLMKFQRTSSPPIFMTDFISKYWLALADSRTVCVVDRFHLTEYVMRVLDGKVDKDILTTTTNMVDIMLAGVGAITYFIDTPIQTRIDRSFHRDIDHRAKEWPSYVELDATWNKALKTFTKSKVIRMPGISELDINEIIEDIVRRQSLETHVQAKITMLPPVINSPQEELTI